MIDCPHGNANPGLCPGCASDAAETGKQTESTQRGRAEHLKPHWWQPGQSGNPNGRPRKPSLRLALERSLRKAEAKADGGQPLYAEPDDEGHIKQLRSPTIDELAGEWLRLALHGDRDAMRALTELRDTLDGKPTQRVEHTGADGDAIRVTAGDVRAKLAAIASAVVDEAAECSTGSGESD